MNYRVLHLADLERFLELRMEFLLSYQDVPKDFQNITENYLRKHYGNRRFASVGSGGGRQSGGCLHGLFL